MLNSNVATIFVLRQSEKIINEIGVEHNGVMERKKVVKVFELHCYLKILFLFS